MSVQTFIKNVSHVWVHVSKKMKLSSNKSQFSTRDVLAHHLSFSLKHHSPNPPKHALSSFRVSPQQLPFILKFVVGQQDSYSPKLTVGKYVKCCRVRT